MADLGYAFPPYFCYFFRVAFFLCLVPFWVKLDDTNNVQFVTYKLHWIVCGIVQTFTFVLTVIQIPRGCPQSIKENPIQVFYMISYVCCSAYLVVFARVVWSKKILNLVHSFPMSHLSAKVNKTHGIYLTKQMSVLIMTYHYILLIDIDRKRLQGGFSHLGDWFWELLTPFWLFFIAADGSWTFQEDDDTTLYTHMLQIKPNSTETFIFDDLNKHQKVGLLWYVVANSLLYIFMAFIDVFTLLPALVLYEITSKIDKRVNTEPNLTITDLLKLYEKLWSYMRVINEVSHSLCMVGPGVGD